MKAEISALTTSCQHYGTVDLSAIDYKCHSDLTIHLFWQLLHRKSLHMLPVLFLTFPCNIFFIFFADKQLIIVPKQMLSKSLMSLEAECGNFMVVLPSVFQFWHLFGLLGLHQL